MNRKTQRKTITRPADRHIDLHTNSSPAVKGSYGHVWAALVDDGHGAKIYHDDDYNSSNHGSEWPTR